MKKSHLLKQKLILASDELVELAKTDIPVRKVAGYYPYREILSYQRGVYLMAAVENGILTVSFFLADHLMAGGHAPVYSLFIDRAKDSFIGYHYLTKSWTEKMLYKEPFLTGPCDFHFYCGEGDLSVICGYLGTDCRDAGTALYTFQEGQRKRRLAVKYQAIVSEWDRKLLGIRPEPKDWEHWQKKTGVSQHFIFYRYSRKKNAIGYCTWCEKEVPLVGAKHNRMGKCPCCRHKIQYKAAGKARSVSTREESAFLLQTFGSGFVVREYRLSVLYPMSDYRKPKLSFYEHRRFLYDSSLAKTEFYFGFYHGTQSYRWIQGRPRVSMYPGWNMYDEEYYMGSVYGRTLPAIRKEAFTRTGFREYVKSRKYVYPVDYLDAVRNMPVLERIVKAGLDELTEDILQGKDIYYKEGRSLGSSLGIDRFRMRRLRDNRGGAAYLQWLVFEKGSGKLIPDRVILWMCRNDFSPDELMFILDRMNPEQIMNYLERQCAQSGESTKEMLSTWKDYLSMAKRVGLDVNDAIIYRARKLTERHAEIVQQVKDKELLIRASEISENYPQVDAVCAELERYEFEDGEYQILAPEKIEDILAEGDALQHCINRDDTYFERMSRRESYILFLRRQSEPEKPFYTLEVEPDGTVRQKRTLYNRQTEDLSRIEGFLGKWQKQLAKKLRTSDLELAGRSRDLRKKELDELREKDIRINGTDFCGKLLADVLEEDLMEASGPEQMAA